MNPTPDSSFDSLKALLALKRYEQPPPGYLEGFSGQVLARIEAAESAKVTPWWRAWLPVLDRHPILVGAYSVAVCGLFLLGMAFSQIAREANEANQASWESENSLANATLAIPASTTDPSFWGSAFSVKGELRSSLTPVMQSQPPGFLFDGTGLRTQPASFKNP